MNYMGFHTFSIGVKFSESPEWIQEEIRKTHTDGGEASDKTVIINLKAISLSDDIADTSYIAEVTHIFDNGNCKHEDINITTEQDCMMTFWTLTASRAKAILEQLVDIQSKPRRLN